MGQKFKNKNKFPFTYMNHTDETHSQYKVYHNWINSVNVNSVNIFNDT